MKSADIRELFPRCGAFRQADGSVKWRVWAPRAESLDLVLFGDSPSPRVCPMKPAAYGHFIHHEADVQQGQRYAFRFPNGFETPDPASLWQPEGVHRPSAVYFPEDFAWSDESWQGVSREELVVYELHVGTFSPEGTFEAIIPRLPALRELGVTAIELLPVAQFPGDRGWGYDGVHPYAAQSSYGGPQGLQKLVDACHAEGLALLLDVVYNHLGPEGNYLGMFGHYFTDHYHTPWGDAVNFDSEGCEGLRAFVTNNVRMWLQDFHCDGLRIDAIHAIYDFGAKHILREMQEVANDVALEVPWKIHMIAESSLNDVRILDAPKAGGYGLTGQWSDDFHHCVHTHLTGEHDGYYADYTSTGELVKALNQPFVYDGCYSIYRQRRHGASPGKHPGDAFVISIQNHDQVGNRARGDRFGTLLTPEQQRLAAGLLLLAPYTPMLFMGEEYGETRPFPFFCSFLDPNLIEAVRRGRKNEFAEFAWEGDIPDPHAVGTFQSAKLSWEWPAGSFQAGLRQMYQDLLLARKQWAPLQDFVNREAELCGPDHSLLKLVRGCGDDRIVCYFNLSNQPRPLPKDFPPGMERLVTSTDVRYGGSGNDAASTLEPFAFVVQGHLQDGE